MIWAYQKYTCECPCSTLQVLIRTAQWPGFVIAKHGCPSWRYVNLVCYSAAAGNYSVHPNWIRSSSLWDGACRFNVETCSRDFLGTILSVTWLCQSLGLEMCRNQFSAFLCLKASPHCSIDPGCSELRLGRPQQLLSMAKMLPYTFSTCFNAKPNINWWWCQWV